MGTVNGGGGGRERGDREIPAGTSLPAQPLEQVSSLLFEINCHHHSGDHLSREVAAREGGYRCQAQVQGWETGNWPPRGSTFCSLRLGDGDGQEENAQFPVQTLSLPFSTPNTGHPGPPHPHSSLISLHPSL